MIGFSRPILAMLRAQLGDVAEVAAGTVADDDQIVDTAAPLASCRVVPTECAARCPRRLT